MVASLWRDAVAKASHDAAVSCSGGGPITANVMEPVWCREGGYFLLGTLLVNSRRPAELAEFTA